MWFSYKERKLVLIKQKNNNSWEIKLHKVKEPLINRLYSCYYLDFNAAQSHPLIESCTVYCISSRPVCNCYNDQAAVRPFPLRSWLSACCRLVAFRAVIKEITHLACLFWDFPSSPIVWFGSMEPRTWLIAVFALCTFHFPFTLNIL